MSDYLRDLYDRRYAEEVWRPLVLRPEAWSTNRYDDVARLLRGERGRLLDVGCGSGHLVFGLRDQFERLVGIDISQVRIATANRALGEHYPSYHDKVEFLPSPSGRLPFEDSSFDVVVACAVLEHVVDVFGFMDELARVCRSGGCAVITVPNICYLKHVLGLLVGRIPCTGARDRNIAGWRREGWDGGHLHYFTKGSLRGLLVDVGFLPEEWTGDGKLARLRRWYANFAGHIAVRARRT